MNITVGLTSSFEFSRAEGHPICQDTGTAASRTGKKVQPIRNISSETIPDYVLLDRIANGDQEAFWLLWVRYYDDMYILYHRLCKGNRQEIHDNLGNLSTRLIESLPHHAKSIQNSRTWLKRTAVNHFIDNYRSHGRRTVLVGSLVEIAAIADGNLSNDDINPERSNADSIMLNRVVDVIKGIKDVRMRKAAHMRFFEEESYAVIAASLSVSEELARKWIQQVRMLLRQHMPDCSTETKGNFRHKGKTAPSRRKIHVRKLK
jgi:RNA polymerase sigma factor (sigma-70 family)